MEQDGKKGETDDKYDPMEAENESEEENANDTAEGGEENSQEDQEEDDEKKDDQKNKDEKVEWSDGENEFEPEVGNLMDDTADGKNEKADAPKSTAAARGRPSPRPRGQRARRSRR